MVVVQKWNLIEFALVRSRRCMVNSPPTGIRTLTMLWLSLNNASLEKSDYYFTNWFSTPNIKQTKCYTNLSCIKWSKLLWNTQTKCSHTRTITQKSQKPIVVTKKYPFLTVSWIQFISFDWIQSVSSYTLADFFNWPVHLFAIASETNQTLLNDIWWKRVGKRNNKSHSHNHKWNRNRDCQTQSRLVLKWYRGLKLKVIWFITFSEFSCVDPKCFKWAIQVRFVLIRKPPPHMMTGKLQQE